MSKIKKLILSDRVVRFDVDPTFLYFQLLKKIVNQNFTSLEEVEVFTYKTVITIDNYDDITQINDSVIHLFNDFSSRFNVTLKIRCELDDQWKTQNLDDFYNEFDGFKKRNVENGCLEFFKSVKILPKITNVFMLKGVETFVAKPTRWSTNKAFSPSSIISSPTSTNESSSTLTFLTISSLTSTNESSSCSPPFTISPPTVNIDDPLNLYVLGDLLTELMESDKISDKMVRATVLSGKELLTLYSDLTKRMSRVEIGQLSGFDVDYRLTVSQFFVQDVFSIYLFYFIFRTIYVYVFLTITPTAKLSFNIQRSSSSKN